MRDAVVLTERPARMRWDERHRPHADDGPAIDARGWSVAYLAAKMAEGRL